MIIAGTNVLIDYLARSGQATSEAERDHPQGSETRSPG